MDHLLFFFLRKNRKQTAVFVAIHFLFYFHVELPTYTYGRVAQPGRAPALHAELLRLSKTAGGPEFKSRRVHLVATLAVLCAAFTKPAEAQCFVHQFVTRSAKIGRRSHITHHIHPSKDEPHRQSDCRCRGRESRNTHFLNSLKPFIVELWSKH